MNDAMMRMMKMKKKSNMSDSEQEAKTSVLENLRDSMSDQMGKKLGGMKKVTVAAPDEEGLEAGLDKAKELVEAKEPASPEEDSEMEMEGMEEDKHPSNMSSEEIDEKLKELMMYKDKLKKDLGV